MSAHFSNGQEILEPQDSRNYHAFPYIFYGNTITQPIVFDFGSKRSRIAHAFKHVIAGHYVERWDNLNSIPRNNLHRIRNMDSVRQIINNHSTPIVNASSYISIKITNEEYKILQKIQPLSDLADCYKQILSNILGKCINHIERNCRDFNPHCHFLKSQKSGSSKRFAQVIKFLDAQSGILIIAIVRYTYNPNSGIVFEKKNKFFVIKTGYRFYRSSTPEERTMLFDSSEKELCAMESEQNYDPAYPVILDIQKHFPEYEAF